jgi:hypothetical protein
MANSPSRVTRRAIESNNPYSYSKRGVTVGRGRIVVGSQLMMLVVLSSLSWVDVSWQFAGR